MSTTSCLRTRSASMARPTWSGVSDPPPGRRHVGAAARASGSRSRDDRPLRRSGRGALGRDRCVRGSRHGDVSGRALANGALAGTGVRPDRRCDRDGVRRRRVRLGEADAHPPAVVRLQRPGGRTADRWCLDRLRPGAGFRLGFARWGQAGRSRRRPTTTSSSTERDRLRVNGTGGVARFDNGRWTWAAEGLAQRHLVAGADGSVWAAGPGLHQLRPT